MIARCRASSILLLRRVLVAATATVAFSAATGPLLAQGDAELPAIVGFRIGFDGAYRLGSWTEVEVQLRGGSKPVAGLVEITAADSEGVSVSVSTPANELITAPPGELVTCRLTIRPGQQGAPISIRWLTHAGDVLASRVFYAGGGSADFPSGLPAVNRLVVTLGTDRGVSDLVRGEESSHASSATVAIQLDDAASLPTQWYGYEGVDLVVLSTSRPSHFAGLMAHDQRVAALHRWIELGGRLTIFAGANGAEMLQAEGPLAPLLPGRFEAVVPLREAQPLETFSGTATVIDPTRAGATTAIVSGQQFQLPVPRLIEVEGQILAFGGPSPADLPLVVRSRVGLGEITFVAVDPDASPLGDWAGRINLVRQALQWPSPLPGAEPLTSAYSEHEDLVDRLRRVLDSSLVGVGVIHFSWVALAVILYVAFIGPGDFFLVKRGLKRMQSTWITFPLAVVAVCVAAYWASHRAKGSALRVNQVEVVDVDVASGEARGSVWTHFFNPRVARRDLHLTPRFAGRPLASRRDLLVGWIGSTGFGLDGMQGRRGQLGIFDRGYSLSPTLDAILNLPLQQWSTRTIAGRWTAQIEKPLEASLSEASDNMLVGTVSNRTGLKLEDCVLMHANWAYQLADLDDGSTAAVDRATPPRTVRTALIARDEGQRDAAPRLDPLAATAPEIVYAMMFYDAIGGRAYAHAAHRYQSFLDLSRLLRGDQAILLARVADNAGSTWTADDDPLASDVDRRWLYYRFVIPLKKELAPQGPSLSP